MISLMLRNTHANELLKVKSQYSIIEVGESLNSISISSGWIFSAIDLSRLLSVIICPYNIAFNCTQAHNIIICFPLCARCVLRLKLQKFLLRVFKEFHVELMSCKRKGRSGECLQCKDRWLANFYLKLANFFL